MAEADLERMKDYYKIIKRVAKEHGVNPHLIAGIISRESRAGNTLEDGWGDNGKAFGLMQVDVTPDGGNHKPRGKWNDEKHLDQGTEILVGFIHKIQKKFPRWSREKQLKGGIAAYNMGDGNVREGYDVDHFTTGQDYSNDVVARAQWYHRKERDEMLLRVVGGVAVAVAVFGPAALLALC